MNLVFSAWSSDRSQAHIVVAPFHMLPQAGDGGEGDHCGALKGQHEAVGAILGAEST